MEYLKSEKVIISLEYLRKNYPKFLGMVVRFNFFPAQYLHPTRRKNYFNGKLIDSVWDVDKLNPRISPLILSELGLDGRPYLQFPDPNWSLALLSRERFSRLALFVGASLCGPQVRACLSRDQVLFWREKLGDDAFNFALNSRLLFSNDLFLLNIDSSSDIQEIGYFLIKSSLKNIAPEMQKRILLKLPSEIIDYAIETSIAKKIVNSVFFVLEAEWHSLFKSIHH